MSDLPAASGALARSRRPLLHEWLARSARQRPQVVAIAIGDGRRTFAELHERSDRCAAALQELGVRPGEAVALLMHNEVELVETLFGCAKAGALAVPVNFRLTEPEIAYVLADCAAVGVVADALLAPLARSAAPSGAFVLETGAGGGYERALAAARRPAPPELTGDAVALVMYTSGTTGRPKGALLTHEGLVTSALAWLATMGAAADDVWLSGQPLFHIGGINGLLPFLFAGTTSVYLRSTGFDAGRAIDLIAEHEPTMCIFVPTQWQEICSHPRSPTLAATRLRVAMWGAAGAAQETLALMRRTVPKAEIVSAFGQTEMSGTTTILKGADGSRPHGSVGRPLPGVELRVVDDDGADVPPGGVGEIVYRGPLVMAGYLGDPQATAAAFEGGWFHSGDLVRLEPEGGVVVVDRKKDMIISGGENVYPAEIERVLGEHPAVAEVAVVGIAHPRWGETPLAVVVARDGHVVAEGELLDHCRRSLAGYKKPSAIVIADELPRNAAGKVRKPLLRERYGATPA